MAESVGGRRRLPSVGERAAATVPEQAPASPLEDA
jgi:hypothetical protein